MNTYDIIFEELQSRVLSGELTKEDAEALNDRAYKKYVEDATEPTTFGEAVDAITEYLESKGCCPTKTGETVIGADKNSDTVVNNGKPGSGEKKDLEKTESKVTPDKGLGSKKLASDIDSLINVGDSDNESLPDVKALRLKVYEACDAGIIDVAEKEILLDYLDLDNYELAD